ncbi:bacteriocin [Scytonema tolypothrichoides VB-61278]|nr:bacteriocin [Scytonema tolypothrichoides VB-61278]
MQDELKNVISQAMNTNSESEPEQTTPIAEELSDKELETVAGGVCVGWSFAKVCIGWSFIRNANKMV